MVGMEAYRKAIYGKHHLDGSQMTKKNFTQVKLNCALNLSWSSVSQMLVCVAVPIWAEMVSLFIFEIRMS